MRRKRKAPKISYSDLKSFIRSFERKHYKTLFILGVALVVIAAILGIFRLAFLSLVYYLVCMGCMLAVLGTILGNGWPFVRTTERPKMGHRLVKCGKCGASNNVVVSLMDKAICGACGEKLGGKRRPK